MQIHKNENFHKNINADLEKIDNYNYNPAPIKNTPFNNLKI